MWFYSYSVTLHKILRNYIFLKPQHITYYRGTEEENKNRKYGICTTCVKMLCMFVLLFPFDLTFKTTKKYSFGKTPFNI